MKPFTSENINEHAVTPPLYPAEISTRPSDTMNLLRLNYLALVILTFLLPAQDGFSETKLRPLEKVRVIALIDVGAANIGPAVKLDGSIFRNWYKRVFENDSMPAMKGVATVHYMGLSGDGISSKQIRDYLLVNPIDYSKEAVLIYFSGHGGTADGILGMRYISLSDGRLGELDLLDMFKARSTIFFNDSCSSYDEVTLKRLRTQEMEGHYTVGRDSRPDVYKHLFLKTSGQWIFRAASPGEAAWTSASGSHFTTGLFYHLDPSEIDNFSRYIEATNEVQFDISKFIAAVQFETSQDFKEHKEKVIEQLLSGRRVAAKGSIADAADQRPSTTAFPSRLGQNYLGAVNAGGFFKRNNQEYFTVRVPYSSIVHGDLNADVTFHYPDGGEVVYGGKTVGSGVILSTNSNLSTGILRIEVPARLINLNGFPVEKFGVKVTLRNGNEILATSQMLQLNGTKR